MESVTSGISRLLRSASIIFFGIVIGRGLALLSEVIIIRSLQPSTFGILALAYSISLIVGQISRAGVPSGLTRFLSEEKSHNQKMGYLQASYIIVCIISMSFVLFLLINRYRISSILGDSELSNTLIFFVPFIIFFPISHVSVSVLRSEGENIRTVIARNILPRFGSLSLFVFLSGIYWSYSAAIIYWVSLPIITTLISLYYISRDNNLYDLITISVDTKIVRRIWSFSWPLAVSTSLIIFMTYLDIIMIGYFLDSKKVGLYRSIQPLQQITVFVLEAIRFLFLPIATQLYNNNKLAELSEFYTVATKWTVFFSAPIVIIFILYPKDLVSIFYGNAYLTAAPALSVLVSGLFYNSFVGPNGSLVKAINSPNIEMYAAGVGVVSNIASNIFLIPDFGIVGAAMGTAIGFWVYNSIELILVYNEVNIHPFSLDIIKPALPFLLTCYILRYGTSDIEKSLPTLILIGVIQVFVLFAAVLFTSSVGEYDKKIIRNFL